MNLIWLKTFTLKQRLVQLIKIVCPPPCTKVRSNIGLLGPKKKHRGLQVTNMLEVEIFNVKIVT